MPLVQMPSIIVTGASKGLGLAITQILLESFSCNVLAVSRTLSSELEALQKKHQSLSYLAGDVSLDADNKKAVDTAISTFGQLDGLVLNAGIVDFVRIADTDMAGLEKLYKVNVFSLYSICKHAIPHLRQTKGRIINVSSGAATGHYASWGAYGSSKAAMNHFTATLAVEEPDITSVAVRPGVVATDMQASIRANGQGHMTESDYAKFVKLHTDSALLPADVPGYVIASLAVNAEKELNGQFVDHTNMTGHQKP